MNDHDERILADAKRVVDAWTNAGPHPCLHEAAQQRLMREWPTLGNAVHQLARAWRIR